MIHTVKGFGIVNETEIDVFLEPSCFFHDPVDVGSLISGPLVAVGAGAVAVLCWRGSEEIPHVQGQRNPGKMVGAGAEIINTRLLFRLLFSYKDT